TPIPRRSHSPCRTRRAPPRRRRSSRCAASARRSVATIRAPADRAGNTSSATAGSPERVMSVNLQAPLRDALLPVPGVEIGTARAAIRTPGRRDVLVLRLAAGSKAAGVFTSNRFCAAPVVVCREHLACSAGAVRALVVNTGCANAGTGRQGLDDARESCAALARRLGVPAEAVLPFSTGVILEHLPMQRLLAGIDAAVEALGASDWLDAAEAIMTTDTVAKAASRRIDLHGASVTVTG